MKNPSVLLLDLDGTLLSESKTGVRIDFIYKTLKRTHPYFGKMGSLRFYMECQKILGSYDGKLTNSERVLHNLSQKFQRSEKEILSGIEIIEDYIFPTLDKYFKQIPEAQDFVKWASGKYRLVLATNPVWRLNPIHLRLLWAGLDPSYFELITHSEIMYSCKPRTTYYSQILQLINTPAENCLMIGNDKKMDGAAINAGIETFILKNNKSYNELKTKLLRAI